MLPCFLIRMVFFILAILTQPLGDSRIILTSICVLKTKRKYFVICKIYFNFMRFYLGHPNYDELIISIPCQNRPKIHLRNGAKSPRIHEEESRITTIFSWKHIELFQKKSKQGRFRIHFSENTTWNF